MGRNLGGRTFFPQLQVREQPEAGKALLSHSPFRGPKWTPFTALFNFEAAFGCEGSVISFGQYHNYLQKTWEVLPVYGFPSTEVGNIGMN